MSARYTKYNLQDISAYTLVEILVALTIIGLLFSFGFVSFRDFSRRQVLSDAAKTIQGDLRLAQGDAITGQKPDNINCNAPNTLDSYGFNVLPSGKGYNIEANCAVGLVIVKVIVKPVTLPADLTISTPLPNPLMFKILGQGTNIPSGSIWTLNLTQTGTGNPASVTVTSGGEIK